MANSIPERLRPLLALFDGDIQALTEALLNGTIQLAGYMDEFEALIARYHLVAMMQGMDKPDMTSDVTDIVAGLVAAQLNWLGGFRDYLRALGPAMEDKAAKIMNRARLYGLAAKTAYYEGDIIRQFGRVLPLPAQIGQGTQCGNNCWCSWRIVELDREAGDYDAYWELDPNVKDHCQTCLVRSREWAPVRIRGNRLLQ